MKYFRWEILRNTKPEINWENPCPPSRKLPNSLNAKLGWNGMLKEGALKLPCWPCLSWAASSDSDLPSDLSATEIWEIFPSDWTQFLVEIIRRCKHCNYWWWVWWCWGIVTAGGININYQKYFIIQLLQASICHCNRCKAIFTLELILLSFKLGKLIQNILSSQSPDTIGW